MHHTAIASGCAFLRRRQLPSGRFAIEVSADHEDGGAWVPDPTVFATAVVALNLADVEQPEAIAISRDARTFLRSAKRAAGVWRFWTDEHRWSSAIPFDSDDTACAALAIGGERDAESPTTRVLLANRGRNGLFYTWLVPHRGVCPLDAAYWRCALSGIRAPLSRRAFWRLTEADPDDVDAVVCANVLALLGDRAETAATAAYLTDVVLSGREATCDKWYHRPLAVHHAIARAAAAGVTRLMPAREHAIGRILAHRRPSGGFGDDALDTALALSALADWGHAGDELQDAASALVAAQRPDGSWPREAYYVGGPKQLTRWGSAEVSTAFSVRALANIRSC